MYSGMMAATILEAKEDNREKKNRTNTAPEKATVVGL
jgi:hypothetical protein